MENGFEGWYLAGGDTGLFAGDPSSNYAGLKYVSGGIALIGYQAKTKTEKASVAVDGGGGVNIKGTVRITGDLYVNGTKMN